MTYTRQRNPRLPPRNDRPEDEHGSELSLILLIIILIILITDNTIPSVRNLRAERVELLNGAAASRSDVCEDAV